MPTQDTAAGYGRLSGGWNFASLEIRLQAIQLSPYHAGPTAPRFIRLNTTAAFLTCCCPLPFSHPVKSLHPGTVPQSLPTEQGIQQGSSCRTSCSSRPRGSHVAAGGGPRTPATPGLSSL